MLPDIQSYLNVLPKADRDKIQFVLYTPTGATATAQPNIEIAYAYAKELGLSAEPKVDPWSWQMFKAHVSKYRALPAAALIDEKGETIRSFPPGSFSPEDPVNWAVRHTK